MIDLKYILILYSAYICSNDALWAVIYRLAVRLVQEWPHSHRYRYLLPALVLSADFRLKSLDYFVLHCTLCHGGLLGAALCLRGPRGGCKGPRQVTGAVGGCGDPSRTVRGPGVAEGRQGLLGTICWLLEPSFLQCVC
jgi:hypothetical protein